MLEVRGPGYRVRVVEGLQPPIVKGSGLEVGRSLLMLDAVSGALSESLASLLLPPIEYDKELEDVVRAYRSRVVAEEASELMSRLGPLTQSARIHVSYFAVARMSRLSRLYPCAFNEAVRDLDKLADEYMSYAAEVGSLSDAYVMLRRSKARGLLASVRSRVSGIAMIGLAGAYVRLLLSGLTECQPRPPLEEPMSLVELPEGVLYGNCEMAEAIPEVLGATSCRRSSLLYSTTICEGEEPVIVKDYGHSTLKWMLAGVLSVAAYPFKESPTSRAINEYRSLRALRNIVGTPRVYALCLSPMRALMAREFVEGDPVLSSRDPAAWEEAGRALAALHRAGWALGDPNPGNFVMSKGRPLLIDVEQAGQFSPVKGAWDLAVYYYYSRFFGAPSDLLRESLRAYVRSAGDLWRSVREELFSPGVIYLTATLPPLLLEMHNVIRDIEARP